MDDGVPDFFISRQPRHDVSFSCHVLLLVFFIQKKGKKMEVGEGGTAEIVRVI